MGRTLLGIDLGESPAGGLLERLLDEEDLEKLDARPDGGTSTGDPGGGTGDEDPDEAGADDSGGPTSAGGSGGKTGSDGYGSDSEAGVDRSPAWRTDDGGTDPQPGGTDSLRSRLPSPGPRLRRALLAVAGLVVVAGAVALVVRRYGDRVAAALPDRLHGGVGEATDGHGDETGDDDPGPPAGRETEWSPDARRDGEESDDDDGGAAVAPEGDLGALVALAFLALVAALVRKATEDPHRDPLVDGPD